MNNKQFKTIQNNLPTSPGVYKFISLEDKLIYVGKAKNIRKRVSSYFKNKFDSAKTRFLVRKIHRIDFTIVETEQDALLLENLLIKENQPKYNVQLKDDKTYPYICIKNERFPRIFLTRRLEEDGSEYLGPYTSVKRVRAIIQQLQSLFPLRTCTLNLSQSNIERGLYKVCLEYHIGNCYGPCEGLQPEKSYNESIDHIRNILKGSINPVLKELKAQMHRYSDSFEFEKANQAKIKIELLENYQSKSTIVNPSINDVDVFSIIENDKSAFVNYLKVVNGCIVLTKTIELKLKLNESTEDILIFAITELRRQFKSNSTELLLPVNISLPDSQIKIHVPQRGDKKKLLQLSINNATYYKNQHVSKKASAKPKFHVLESLKIDFRLKEIPLHIECFDNSNIQGNYPVASMVVFKNGKPAKNEYRHYNIKTVHGANDFASMEEIIFRRYNKLKSEQAALPQLIVIDGGKGQLNAGIKALKRLELDGTIAVASIAKRLEEIYFPDDPVPLHISKRSVSLKLIQQLRNEAHRFAVGFHRTKRKNALLKTSLTDIPGIGKKTSDRLLKSMRSDKKIKQASLDELALLVGLDKAGKIKKFYEAKEVS